MREMLVEAEIIMEKKMMNIDMEREAAMVGSEMINKYNNKVIKERKVILSTVKELSENQGVLIKKIKALERKVKNSSVNVDVWKTDKKVRSYVG